MALVFWPDAADTKRTRRMRDANANMMTARKVHFSKDLKSRNSCKLNASGESLEKWSELEVQ